MQHRRRIKQTETLGERLRKRAAELRELAKQTGPGDRQTNLLKNAEQCESAMTLDGWLGSKELTPPR